MNLLKIKWKFKALRESVQTNKFKISLHLFPQKSPCLNSQTKIKWMYQMIILEKDGIKLTIKWV